MLCLGIIKILHYLRFKSLHSECGCACVRIQLLSVVFHLNYGSCVVRKIRTLNEKPHWNTKTESSRVKSTRCENEKWFNCIFHAVYFFLVPCKQDEESLKIQVYLEQKKNPKKVLIKNAINSWLPLVAFRQVKNFMKKEYSPKALEQPSMSIIDRS